MAFTPPVTRPTDFLVTAAIWNAEHVDNMNSAWPHLVVRKPADESVTSSIVLQNDDHLVMALAANEVWHVQFGLLCVGNTTGNIRFAFTIPAGATMALAGQGVLTSSSSTTYYAFVTSGAAQLLQADTTPFYYSIEGVVTCAGTAGNLQFQWAQATSNATPTKILTNSTLWAVKLA